MALSVIAAHESGTGSGGISNLGPAAFNAQLGDLLVVYVRWFQNSGQTITGVTDSATNNYVQQGGNIGNSANDVTAIYYAKNCAANAATSVNVAFSANVTFSDVIIYQVRGADTSTPFDAIASATSNVNVSSLTPSITTVATNTIVLAFSSQDTFPFQNITFPAGTWTTNANGDTPASGGPFCNASYQIFSSVQTAMGVQSSWATATTGVCLLVSFRAAGSVPPVSTFVQSFWVE